MHRYCVAGALMGVALAAFAMGCAGTSGPGGTGAEMRSVSFNLTLGGEEAEVSSRNRNYD